MKRLVLLMALTAPSAFAQTVCSKGKISREASVGSTKEYRCVVLYKKTDEKKADKVLWHSDKAAFCEKKLVGFVKKLEAGGWACKKVG